MTLAIWNEAGYDSARIMQISPGSSKWAAFRDAGGTEADYLLQEVAAQHPDAPIPVIIDKAELTAQVGDDRTFRNAWRESLGQITVDMPTARGIHMDTIRAARNAALAAKDIVFMRAVEAGDTDAQSAIAAEKQTLRDIPATFDLTTDSPEALHLLWPSELPARES